MKGILTQLELSALKKECVVDGEVLLRPNVKATVALLNMAQRLLFAREALEMLCKVKRMKERRGKIPEYYEARTHAWDMARNILNMIEEDERNV